MNRAAQTRDVNLSGFVFAERCDHYVGVKQHVKRSAVPQKYLAAAVIAEDIFAGGERILRPAIGETANHSAATVRKMVVFHRVPASDRKTDSSEARRMGHSHSRPHQCAVSYPTANLCFAPDCRNRPPGFRLQLRCRGTRRGRNPSTRR